MKKLHRFLGIILISLFVLSLVGCPGPEKQLFDKIVRPFKKEPTVTVKIANTGQQKRMPLETYIMGVVAGEMEKNWPPAAYAAQAIIARTFTMEYLSRGGNGQGQGVISSDFEEGQAYKPEAITPEIRRAVQETRGKVMTYNKMYTKGWFSASCGGHTASAKIGLAYKGQEPSYITTVTCPEDKVTPSLIKQWVTQLSMQEIQSALLKKGKKITNLSKIIPLGKKYERIINFSLVSSQGKITLAAPDFRLMVGSEKMRSTFLKSFDVKNGKVIMVGKGFGHGVGLCQWGAFALAKDGRTAVQIIKHYYPKIKIVDLW